MKKITLKPSIICALGNVFNLLYMIYGIPELRAIGTTLVILGLVECGYEIKGALSK